MNRVTRNDPRDAWLAAALDARAEDAYPRGDCPHPKRIWDAARLQISLDERLEIVDHISECPTCAEAWRLASELAPADEHTAPPHINASRPLSAMDGRRTLLIGVAAVILVALGLAFMMRRPAAQPDTASIGPAPTAPPTSAPSTSAPPASARAASPPPAAPQTPNPIPVSPPVFLPAPAPRAALADEVAVRNLIVAYEAGIGKESRAPGSTVSINVQNVRIDGRTATATVRLRDTALTQGERQERTGIHQLTFEKTAAGNWVVVSATPYAPPSSPVVEPDEIAIRRVIDTFKTAIETKDIDLYHSVRPSLSAAEEERLRASFQRIDLQVTITIEDIRVEGSTAIARISRQDVIKSGGRQQTMAIRQTLRFEKSAAGWVITTVDPFSSG